MTATPSTLSATSSHRIQPAPKAASELKIRSMCTTILLLVRSRDDANDALGEIGSAAQIAEDEIEANDQALARHRSRRSPADLERVVDHRERPVEAARGRKMGEPQLFARLAIIGG